MGSPPLNIHNQSLVDQSTTECLEAIIYSTPTMHQCHVATEQHPTQI